MKTRISFLYKNQHFIVDTFENVDGRPSLMRIETEQDVTKIEKPAFIKYVREVTDEEEYSTYNMAGIDYKMPPDDKKTLVKFLEKKEASTDKKLNDEKIVASSHTS